MRAAKSPDGPRIPSPGTGNRLGPMLVGICGLADLLVAREAKMLPEMADLLGYRRLPRPPKAPLMRSGSGNTDRRPGEPTVALETGPPADLPFLRVETYTAIDTSDDAAEPERRGKRLRHIDLGEHLPETPGLGSLSGMLPSLRRAAAELRPGAEPDIPALLRHIGRGQVVEGLPRRGRRRWGRAVCIIEDHGEHLVPYRKDHGRFAMELQRLFPDGAVAIRCWLGSGAEFIPEAGTLVLALSDLGTLADPCDGPMARWEAYGRALREAGCRTVALLPGNPARRLDRLRRWWELVGWKRPVEVRDPEVQSATLERLLRLASPAIRIEPGFLRGLRLLLGRDAPGPEIEAEFWQSPLLMSRHNRAAMLDPAEAQRLRREFAAEDRELRRQVLGLLREWRAGLEWVWLEEIISLDEDSRRLIPHRDLEAAADYFARIGEEMAMEGSAPRGALSWFGRVERRLPVETWTQPSLHRALTLSWWAVHRDDLDPPVPPPGYDPAMLPVSTSPRRRFSLYQQGTDLFAGLESEPPGGSLVGQVVSRNGEIVVEPLPDGSPTSFWKSGIPPAFAEDWGTDEFGPWLSFSVPDPSGGKVTQRMRWIPSGRSMMGSAETEEGRDDDEGPQHEVTIGAGFWLFDTACRQALWQPVMGSNPSGSKGAEQPVERVSWNDCVEFLKRLNELVPSLDLRLPSEAEWEYACRAQTKTPFSFGDEIDPRYVNFSRSRTKRGTVSVGSLLPNPWGLHEMHGNVWEWCADHWHGSYEGAPADGSVWLDAESGAGRVIRGGSWCDNARLCRSACRRRLGAGHRNLHLGFRCARVQDGAEPSRGEGESACRSSGSPSPREGGAVLRLDRAAEEAACRIPEAPAFILRTDCERLTFARLTCPAWASAMGRDRYGLWAGIEISDQSGVPVIQRLRFIPPGRFMMGSPENEAGRYEDEGPQHWVTISRGFWLFDTPCTQALWQTVMGSNPSQFQSPDRPVERVSWDDVQDFLERINRLVPGLALCLPSEARWEYACRAGTETAIYSGTLEILGDANAPALDPIAWYGGNSAVDFDLEQGVDLSSLRWHKDRQYPGKKAGTGRVGLKKPNGWGLYDMLGNVWEWCADHWHESYEGAPADGSAWLDAGAESGATRVVRGGSWYSRARRCRSASSYLFFTGLRYYDLGFRCARVQD
jgi:formylglycine-generating enzyme required for sulfatase activity